MAKKGKERKHVANGIAQSYLEHTYNIRFRSSASLLCRRDAQ